MIFLCYPKCTTCKKAQKWLDDKGAEYVLRDIKENNPTYDELKGWFATSGLPIKKFFNTSGTLYRTMNIKEKLPAMNDDQCLKLLAEDGMLVKRPMLIGDGFVAVGFNESQWEKVAGII